jgi:hypothetical protein
MATWCYSNLKITIRMYKLKMFRSSLYTFSNGVREAIMCPHGHGQFSSSTIMKLKLTVLHRTIYIFKDAIKQYIRGVDTYYLIG